MEKVKTKCMNFNFKNSEQIFVNNTPSVRKSKETNCMYFQLCSPKINKLELERFLPRRLILFSEFLLLPLFLCMDTCRQVLMLIIYTTILQWFIVYSIGTTKLTHLDDARKLTHLDCLTVRASQKENITTFVPLILATDSLNVYQRA